MLLTMPPQSQLAWQWAMSVLHSLALFSTIFRVCYQIRQRRIWIDDLLVCVAQVVDICYSVFFWFPGIQFQPRPPPLPPIINLWASNILMYTILWISRIALLLSFSRIFLPRHPILHVTYALVATFTLTWIGLVATASWLCPNGQGGRAVPYDRSCGYRHARLNLAVTSLDIVGDVILVALPLHTLWRIKLRDNERRFILLLFSGSLATLASVTLIVFFQNVPFVFSVDYAVFSISLPHVSTAVAIMVANMIQMVVASFVYRLWRRGSGSPRGKFPGGGFWQRRGKAQDGQQHEDDPILAFGSVGNEDRRSEHSETRETYASDLTRITDDLDPPSTREIQTSDSR